jgi:hypothetical protein
LTSDGFAVFAQRTIPQDPSAPECRISQGAERFRAILPQCRAKSVFYPPGHPTEERDFAVSTRPGPEYIGSRRMTMSTGPLAISKEPSSFPSRPRRAHDPQRQDPDPWMLSVASGKAITGDLLTSNLKTPPISFGAISDPGCPARASQQRPDPLPSPPSAGRPQADHTRHGTD